jgi:hypothetical protein
MRPTLRLAALALALALAPVPRLAAADPLPPDLALVPPDAAGFLSVRVADLWNDGSAATLRKMAKENKELAGGLEEMQKATGLTPADVTRLVLVVPTPGGRGELGVVLTARPYDRAKLLALLGPDANEKKAQGRAFHVSEKKNNALYFATEQAFVFGVPERVEAVVAAQAGKRPDGVLADALARSAEKHAIVVGLDLAALGQELKKGVGPEAKPFLPLLEARSATFTVDVGKGDVTVTARLPFATEEAARQGEKAAAALLDLTRAGLAMGIGKLGKEKPRTDDEKALLGLLLGALRDAEAGLKAARPERSGAVVQGAVRVRTAEPATALAVTAYGLFGVRGPSAPPEGLPREGPTERAR